MQEQLVEWHPVAGIDAPCGGADIAEMNGELTLTLRFSAVVGGITRDLELRFGRVVAFMSHEESAHPWNDFQVSQPVLQNRKWRQYTFPCLEIVNSSWLASFGESRVFGSSAIKHFQLVTLDKVIDVATTDEVTAHWLGG